jgi:membrane protease YdiL (CAAX protease family)
MLRTAKELTLEPQAQQDRVEDDTLGRRQVVVYGVVFESLLGLVGIALGWWSGSLPWFEERAQFIPTAKHVGWGLLATVPLIVLLFVVERIEWAPLVKLSQLVRTQIVPLFRGASLAELLLLSCAAGLGEELLFRGFLQSWIADYWALGNGGAIVVAGALFGLLHRLTWTYAVFATAVGCYFGWLFLVFGSLWVPMIAHALYDFLALVYLLRSDLQRNGAGLG